MTEPMTDAELAEVREQHAKWGLSTNQASNVVFDRLFARLEAERTRADAAEAERDAALARAMPEPRFMATVEEVEALPAGDYRVVFAAMPGTNHVVERDPWERDDRTLLWMVAGDPAPWPDAAFVGAWISGPLPDLPIPPATTAAQETPDAG